MPRYDEENPPLETSPMLGRYLSSLPLKPPHRPRADSLPSVFSTSDGDSGVVEISADPSAAFDAWAGSEGVAIVAVVGLAAARAGYHLACLAGGLYLAQGAFCALAPRMNDSLAWAPLVVVTVSALMFAAPFWGMALSYAFRRIVPAVHWRQVPAAIALGLLLAAARLAAAAAALVPCHHSGPAACAAKWAAALRPDSAALPPALTALALTFAPLVVLWLVPRPMNPDGAPARSGTALIALRTAVVALSLAHIYLTLALGKQNTDLRQQLGSCRPDVFTTVPLADTDLEQAPFKVAT